MFSSLMSSSTSTTISEGRKVLAEVAGVRCVLVGENGDEICELEMNVVVQIVRVTHGKEDIVTIETGTWAAQLLPEVPVLVASEELYIFSNITTLHVSPEIAKRVKDPQTGNGKVCSCPQFGFEFMYIV
eukprot:m.19966 g.19966  ORF g.19966 m.19966 type:complete len:129 (-) comp5198_c1_seq1:1081-1467(-)